MPTVDLISMVPILLALAGVVVACVAGIRRTWPALDGWAQSLWIVQGSLGVTERFLLSPLAGYHDARRLKGGRDCALVDIGCSPRFAWEALRTLGLVSWEDWPFVAANVNAEVPWNARRKAIDHDWLAYFRIEEEGDARCPTKTKWKYPVDDNRDLKGKGEKKAVLDADWFEEAEPEKEKEAKPK